MRRAVVVLSVLVAIALLGLAALLASGAQPQAQQAGPSSAAPAGAGALDLARIRPNVRTGFSNGGWKYDRYKELESLDRHKKIVVADLKGPGVIRHIHTTAHRPEALFARGIVLEIWFDDAKEPAVHSPLADFFGDGCNGKGEPFSSLLVECPPGNRAGAGSYNCYIPMPFKTRARVMLRNDTDRNAMNYSYVEWESLPKWSDDLGYFHATYARRCEQVARDDKKTFFEIKGQGHLVGRQFSFVTDEPMFRDLYNLVEANNEVDIDGRERVLDYLGTEDAFTFSWGYKHGFAGLRAGMPYFRRHGNWSELSIYRFHEHMPIRFNKSLKWSLNWRQEAAKFSQSPVWLKKVQEGACWVDFASVFYWYSTDPGGHKHMSLPPVPDRQKRMIRSNEEEARKRRK